MIFFIVIFSLLLFHILLVENLSFAAQEHRIKIVKGLKELQANDAPEWLIELWTTAICTALFKRGTLKHMVYGLGRNKKEARAQLAEFAKKIHALPDDMKKTHSDMDKDLAIVLAFNSPYFLVVLAMYALFKLKVLDLKSTVPHREMRAGAFLAA